MLLTAVSDFPAVGIGHIFPSWWRTCFFSFATVTCFPPPDWHQFHIFPRLAQVAWGWRLHVFQRLSLPRLAKVSHSPRLASVTSFYSDFDWLIGFLLIRWSIIHFIFFIFLKITACRIMVSATWTFWQTRSGKGSDIKEFSLTHSRYSFVSRDLFFLSDGHPKRKFKWLNWKNNIRGKAKRLW